MSTSGSLVSQLVSKLPQEHRDILLWRDPRKSGICFGGSTAVYLLLAWAPISFCVLGLQALVVSSRLGGTPQLHASGCLCVGSKEWCAARGVEELAAGQGGALALADRCSSSLFTLSPAHAGASGYHATLEPGRHCFGEVRCAALKRAP